MKYYISIGFRLTTCKCLCFIVLIFCLMGTGCKKFLDARPDKKLVIPKNLEDAQNLLDAYTYLNSGYPSIAIESDDDHYISENDFNALNIALRQNYTWDKNAFFTNYNAWLELYRNILQVNIALETVENIHPQSSALNTWKRLKGTALFFRAFNFYLAAQYWASPYDKNTVNKKLGIPLRLTSDVNEKITRASLKKTYKQIIKDYKKAIVLLPTSTSLVSRPSKAAAYGALSRVYLTMNDYENAKLYADSCLQLYNTLMDYNNMDQDVPIPAFNKEVIFQSESLGARSAYAPRAKVDSVLYQLYNVNDLRRSIYFSKNDDGTLSFNGSYATSPYTFFNGIATDEMYLIRAECYARNGEREKAMEELNTLLRTRWKAGTFVPFKANDINDALKTIIEERRKELTGRGLRWLDLRRLNLDPQFAITLYRKENGRTYSLPPKDPRYTFYIPNNVIIATGMTQNVR